MSRYDVCAFDYLLYHSPYIEELEKWYLNEVKNWNRKKAQKIKTVVARLEDRFYNWHGGIL